LKNPGLWKREKDLSQDTPDFRNQILTANKGKKIEAGYEEIRDDCSYRRQILDGMFKKESRCLSDSKLFSSPSKYPILNTWINVNIYCNYVALSNPEGPSKKSSSDYRHLINANVTDLFVTADKTLLNNASKLSPYLRTMSCEDFLRF
jgi:hypothetical protein